MSRPSYCAIRSTDFLAGAAVRRASQARAGIWLLLLLSILTLAGCSTRFVYNQLDTLIVWRVSSFVTLSPDQRSALRADIRDQLEVLRQSEMPRMATLFGSAATDVRSGNVTPAVIERYYQDMLVLYDDVMLGLVPLSHRFLQGLTEAQIDELFGKLAEINDEMYEEYSGETPELREQNRTKSAVRSIQSYTGRLTAEQRELVRNGLADMEDASEQWIAYQRDWQGRMRSLIEANPPDAEYREELTRLLVYPRDIHSVDYRARVDANRELLNDMLAELFNGLNQRQRARMVRKLEGYVDTLNGLAAAG